MKKILVIFAYQWGYNTDYLFFCKLLQEKYDVTYIGYNLSMPEIPNYGVSIINVPYNGKMSLLKLWKAVLAETKKENYSYVLFNYFLTCSILMLLMPKRLKKLVDIRTSFIYKNKIKTKIFNILLRSEVLLFKNISVVSAGVKEFLKLPSRTHILPLGAPFFPETKKSMDELNFLYVGTFYDRNIPKTIKAFSKFLDSHRDKISSKYTIIGFGSDKEIEDIKAAIKSDSLGDFITYVGSVRYPALDQYFSTHNVGVSFIPLTDYYDCQPPTKTFEYLLSGTVVLGTNTSENRKVINNSNGVLVGDTIEEFYKGMVLIYEKRKTYDSIKIQNESFQYSWTSIVNENLIPYLKACS